MQINRPLTPGLDPAGSSSTHALVLHDEEIPLTGHGLGTRRLISLAIQAKAFTAGEIILIDEIEYGLEPHRLHHLLRHLKKRINADKGQVIVTIRLSGRSLDCQLGPPSLREWSLSPAISSDEICHGLLMGVSSE